jgi:hypothetical protein
MSRYESESGSWKFHPKDWANFRKSFITAVNKHEAERYDLAKKTFKRAKGYYDFLSKRGEAAYIVINGKKSLLTKEEKMYIIAKGLSDTLSEKTWLENHVFDKAQSLALRAPPSRFKKGEVHIKSEWSSSFYVEDYGMDEWRRYSKSLKKGAPTKKAFPKYPVSKDLELSISYEASIDLDNESQTATWHVPRNNHAVSEAKEDKRVQTFFYMIRQVKFPPGYGGGVQYASEYDNDYGNDYDDY